MSAWMSEKPTTKSGLQLEDLVDLRAGEGADLRFFAARVRRAHGEAGDADDAIGLAQCVQDFGRLLGQADDAPRTTHGYSIRRVPVAVDPLVALALVQAVTRAVPELDQFRHDPETGPVRRTRHLDALETGLHLGDPRARIPRATAASATAARPRRRSGWGAAATRNRRRPPRRHRLDRALDFHLHAVAHHLPVEQQRRLRIAGQLPALAAVEVGVEHEAARVEALEQHGARRRLAALPTVASVIAVGSGSLEAFASSSRPLKVSRISGVSIGHSWLLVFVVLSPDGRPIASPVASGLRPRHWSRPCSTARCCCRRGRPCSGSPGCRAAARRTLARQLVLAGRRRGLTVVAVSIDDFYLGRRGTQGAGAGRESAACTARAAGHARRGPGLRHARPPARARRTA